MDLIRFSFRKGDFMLHFLGLRIWKKVIPASIVLLLILSSVFMMNRYTYSRSCELAVKEVNNMIANYEINPSFEGTLYIDELINLKGKINKCDDLSLINDYNLALDIPTDLAQPLILRSTYAQYNLRAFELEVTYQELLYLGDHPSIKPMLPQSIIFNNQSAKLFNGNQTEFNDLFSTNGKHYEYGLYTLWQLFDTPLFFLAITVIVGFIASSIVDDFKAKQYAFLKSMNYPFNKLIHRQFILSFFSIIGIFFVVPLVFIGITNLLGLQGSLSYPVPIYNVNMNQAPVLMYSFEMHNPFTGFALIPLSRYFIKLYILLIGSISLLTAITLCLSTLLKDKVKVLISLITLVGISLFVLPFNALNPLSYLNYKSVLIYQQKNASLIGSLLMLVSSILLVKLTILVENRKDTINHVEH